MSATNVGEKATLLISAMVFARLVNTRSIMPLRTDAKTPKTISITGMEAGE
jgi:hypothetical protein